ncbi:hypothetical protein MHYP_G00246440 [Metynnis hypsauchen]
MAQEAGLETTRAWRRIISTAVAAHRAEVTPLKQPRNLSRLTLPCFPATVGGCHALSSSSPWVEAEAKLLCRHALCYGERGKWVGSNSKPLFFTCCRWDLILSGLAGPSGLMENELVLKLRGQHVTLKVDSRAISVQYI